MRRSSAFVSTGRPSSVILVIINYPPKDSRRGQSVLLLQRQLDFFFTPGRKLIAYDETGTGVPVQ